MKLFTINKEGKFVQFKEKEFKEENKEIDLEILLENNPEYFFENSKILIIGRQVATNLNTFIDLIGIDELGNTVVIELKRDKTPRETLAQLIEYASFIDNLDYEQLNEIFQNYSGEEVGLEEYHQQYFENDTNQNVSWNKNSKLVIIAQDITKEIKQTSLYLIKKGIDVYCIEFKYFVNNSNIKMISSDFVVGDDEFIRQKVKSETKLPKTNQTKFIDSLDDNGKFVFEKLFDFADKEKLMLRWGSKGFSLNLPFENGFVALCFGYPPNSVFKQSIYSGFEEIAKKVNDSEKVISDYKNELKKLKNFENAKTNLKWVITKKYSETEIEKYIETLKSLLEQIKKYGLNK
jgi:RecB family endonuclease NucS